MFPLYPRFVIQDRENIAIAEELCARPEFCITLYLDSKNIKVSCLIFIFLVKNNCHIYLLLASKAKFLGILFSGSVCGYKTRNTERTSDSCCCYSNWAYWYCEDKCDLSILQVGGVFCKFCINMSPVGSALALKKYKGIILLFCFYCRKRLNIRNIWFSSEGRLLYKKTSAKCCFYLSGIKIWKITIIQKRQMQNLFHSNIFSYSFMLD